MRCAAWKISGTVSTAASDVSFTSEMNEFDSGGSATRVACGRITRRSAWLRVMPME